MRQSNPDIILIFITNLAQYVMKGYQVDALDYVLKPIQYPAFDLKFQKALTLCGQTKKTEYMVISANEGVFRMDAADVQYIEIYQHHIQYGTTKGIYNGYGTLKRWIQLPATGIFFPVQESYDCRIKSCTGNLAKWRCTGGKPGIPRWQGRSGKNLWMCFTNIILDSKGKRIWQF